MAAASHTDSSTSGARAPTPAEAAAFLADDDSPRAQRFSSAEQVSAAAALTWTLAHNARCQVDVLSRGGQLPHGPVLAALLTHADNYLGLRW